MVNGFAACIRRICNNYKWLCRYRRQIRYKFFPTPLNSASVAPLLCHRTGKVRQTVKTFIATTKCLWAAFSANSDYPKFPYILENAH